MLHTTISHTKARSKAAKRRVRRGRPRIEGKPREPNGRISRAKQPPEPIDLLALKMRAKHTGLSLREAADPRSSSTLGRWAMTGRNGGLSGDQYEAALKFLDVRNDYLRAKGLPGALYDDSTSIGDEDAHARWVQHAELAYKEAQRAIQEAQFDNGRENLYAGLQYVIIEGQDLPHLIGSVRLCLNALYRHFFRHKN